MKVSYLTHLDTREIAEGFYQLLAPFYARIDFDDGRVVEVMIPAGFVTDFASVPKIPFAYLLFGGIGNKAAVVHDGFYSRFKGITVTDMATRLPFEYDRRFADIVFYFALLACGIAWYKRQVMYRTVRLFGGKYYKVKG